jgi:hypothetical protein
VNILSLELSAAWFPIQLKQRSISVSISACCVWPRLLAKSGAHVYRRLKSGFIIASSRRCGAFPAFERFSQLSTMVFYLKKATVRSQEGLFYYTGYFKPSSMLFVWEMANTCPHRNFEGNSNNFRSQRQAFATLLLPTVIKNHLSTPFLILLILLRPRLHSLIIRIIGSVLRNEDTAFGVKSTQRSGSPKGGLYSAKSSIKPHLRTPHVNQGPTEAVKSSVPICA